MLIMGLVMSTQETKWILCPMCGERTRVKIKETTVIKDFPLYCHRCKKEFSIEVQNFIVKVLDGR